MGKSELAAAVALLLCCGDGEERAEVYGCAADRQQASIVFEVAADMVRMCPALAKRVKILSAAKRIVFTPTNSFIKCSLLKPTQNMALIYMVLYLMSFILSLTENFLTL